MTRRHVFLWLSVLLALGACGKATPPRPPHQAAVTAAVSRVALSSLPERAALPGTVRGAQTAVLSARRGGQVTRVTVQAGARVTKGTVLIEVDTAAAEAAVADAGARLTRTRAAWRQARDDEDRYRALYKEGAVTLREHEQAQHRLDAARAAYEAARQSLASARQRLGYAVVRAPFSGLVTERDVDPGDIIPPGGVLMTLAGGPPEIRVYAGQALFRRITKDTPVRVSIDGATYPAAITQRVKAADPVTHTHLIKLTLPAAAAAPVGAYADAAFTLGVVQGLIVPAGAVVTRAGMTGVLVVDDRGVAHFREVRAAHAIGGRIPIAAGLSVGETVVTRPTPAIGNGTRIIVKAGHE